jgi:hypothetical protein
MPPPIEARQETADSGCPPLQFDAIATLHLPYAELDPRSAVNFSTYSLLSEGLTLTILTVATVTFVGWLVERAKQRRMERLLAEMEAPTSAATEPLSTSERSTHRRPTAQGTTR